MALSSSWSLVKLPAVFSLETEPERPSVAALEPFSANDTVWENLLLREFGSPGT